MQKVIITIVFLLTVMSFSYSQEKEMFSITVSISGMKSDKGDVYVALYSNEKSFLKDAFKGSIVAVKDKKAKVIFKNIEIGIYAISVFHDQNDNKKMDTNFMGIPKEPIGCSNGATGFMGPPKFKKAKFTVATDVVIPVRVK